MEKTVVDFFAGIGLVELGFKQANWDTIYSVDYSVDKFKFYQGHFGNNHYKVEDIKKINGDDVPNTTLAHASFPCTDVSVAGGRAGLKGEQTSTFWEFVRIIEEMGENKPPFLLLENVEGFLTSHKGKDLKKALSALCDLNYSVDIFLIDAVHFVPQSRSRLFIICNNRKESQSILEQDLILTNSAITRPQKVREFIKRNSDLNWYINELAQLPDSKNNLKDLIDIEDEDWWSTERKEYLFEQMFKRHQEKVIEMMKKSEWSYGTIFRRTRMRDGRKQSTAELRTDGVAGCLRTPKGGSARQILLRAGFGEFNVRLLNGIECSRLMGADSYSIDEDLSLNKVLYGFGDAVCVPVIKWIAENVFNPNLVEAEEPLLIEELN